LKLQTPEGAGAAPRSELIPGLSLLAFALALVLVALYRKSLPIYLAKLGLEIAAPLLLSAGAFLSNYFTARSVARGPRPPQRFVRRYAKALPKPLELARTASDRARRWFANIDWVGDWLPLALMLLTCTGTLYLGYRVWVWPANGPSARLDQWLFGGLVGVCFPLLVLERRVAGLPERRVLGQLSLVMLLRLLLAVFLLLAVSYLLRWLALPYWTICERIALLATTLTAAEILLRNAAYLFMPLPPLEQRH
jgi:hypothetical protein